MPEAVIGADKSRREADKAETARHVIRAVVDLDEFTPLMVTIPEGNRGPILEMCAQISRRLKWVGVGRHSNMRLGGWSCPYPARHRWLTAKSLTTPTCRSSFFGLRPSQRWEIYGSWPWRLPLWICNGSPAGWSEPGQGRTCRSVISSTCQVWATGTTTQSLLTVRLSNTRCWTWGGCPLGRKGTTGEFMRRRPPLSVCRQTRDHTIWVALCGYWRISPTLWRGCWNTSTWRGWGGMRLCMRSSVIRQA